MVFQSFNLVTRTTVIRNVLAACVPEMPFWRVLLGAFRKQDKLTALESLDLTDRSSVDFPAPERPMIATNSPS